MTNRIEGSPVSLSAGQDTREPATLAKPSLNEAAKLRATAARYRILARSFFDLRVIAAVESCAHELEAEADMIEASIARMPPWVVHRGRDRRPSMRRGRSPIRRPESAQLCLPLASAGSQGSELADDFCRTRRPR
ncbi:MAG TPA: hypothetical protein VEU06_08725 [Micropepsaceae bacterium]|nr:hypothetical protein [Micropepsaceae bacterium]